jgi:hypothetical protein
MIYLLKKNIQYLFSTLLVNFLTYIQGTKGDAAIDEIKLTPNKICAPVSEFGNLISHYCDFERDDNCNYVNDTARDGKWIRTKPRLSQFGFEEPNKDNTYQTREGKFMLYSVKL